MAELNKQSKTPNTYFGVGGERMVKHGFTKNYADVNKIHDKPFYPFQNTIRNMWDRAYNVTMAPVNFNNKRIFQEMEKNNFFRDVVAQSPDMIIGYGNYFLQRKVMKRIDEVYAAQGLHEKPAVFFFNNLNVSWVIEDEAWMDHCVHTNPMQNVNFPMNFGYYHFPGVFRGDQGLFNAYKYLYSTSPNHKNLAANNKIYLSEKHNSLLMEELIHAERERFRTQYQIDQTTTLFFVSPGSQEAEVKKALPVATKGIDLFIESFGKEQGLNSDNFAVVISAPKDCPEIKAMVAKASVKCKIIIVYEANDRYAAMAASDLGACMLGESVSECVGMQLPVLVMDNLTKWDSYFTSLYNEFSSDVNIALKGECYPELYSWQFPEKLCELWGEIYTNPKKRYHFVKRHEAVIPSLLPETDMSENTTTALVREGMSFRSFEEPNVYAVRRMIELTSEWREKRSDMLYKEFRRGLWAKGSSRV